MKLLQALKINAQTRMAFVGAGGKSTAMFGLARQYGKPIIVTASTHLSVDQIGLADRHWVVEDIADLAQFAIDDHVGVMLITGGLGEDARTAGLAMDILDKLAGIANDLSLPMLIEADGSRRKPLKAPVAHEPAVPTFATTVVVTAGMSGVGQRLTDERVHRAEAFAGLAEIELGEEITADALVKVLTHSHGGGRNIPIDAKKIVLLNQVDTPEMAGAAKQISGELLGAFDEVVIANLLNVEREVLAVHQPVAGVVLAAGGSKRLGEPKQLLGWRGQSFIRAVTETALAAGCSPVVVVLGSGEKEIRLKIEDLPVQIVVNTDWEAGQSTSVMAGLQAVGRDHPAVFFLVDQPQITPKLVETLIARHAESLSAIVAPIVDGQRGNPVLFDAVTFDDLAKITGEKGGRQIFSKYRANWVEWVDSAMVFDVDTLEDYARLLNYEE